MRTVPMPQFPIPHPASPGEEIILRKKEAHHLRDVLRVAAGEGLELFDGQGGRYEGEVIAVTPREVRLKILKPLPSPVLQGKILLGQAVLKRAKMEIALQKAAELGVGEILPFFSSRTVPTEKGEREERWQRIVGEASKQCGRAGPPLLHPPQPFEQVIRTTSADQKILFWEGSSKPLAVAGKTILALIGPEGGFSDEEAREAESNGCETARLGPLILRAETATVAAVTLIQHGLGNL